MTHGVPADFSAQVERARKLAKARGLDIYGVTWRDGHFVGLECEKRRKEVEIEAEPVSMRGVQAQLL